jgi:hypothetical protein
LPRPVFIIASQGGAEDRETGLLSIYEVLEKMVATPVPKKNQDDVVIIRNRPVRVTSTWMRLETDNENQDFEHQMIFTIQPANEPIGIVPPSIFRFSKPFQRFTTLVNEPFAIDNDGMLIIESRVRAVGTEDWVSQTFPIIVEVVNQDVKAPIANGSPHPKSE